MKAIETRYKGRLFRSRQEARWAVFFDHLRLRWEYEPEGFETSAGRYLPDFRLVTPEDDTPYYFEVKPEHAPRDPRHHAFALETGYPLIIARGMAENYGDQMRGGRTWQWRMRHGDDPLVAMLGGDRGDPLGHVAVFPCAFVGPEGPERWPEGPSGWNSIHKGREWVMDVLQDVHIALYPGKDGPSHYAPILSPEIDAAYAAALSARFEFGQEGAQT